MAYKVLTPRRRPAADGVRHRQPGHHRAAPLEDNLRRWRRTCRRRPQKNEFLATLAHELRNPLAPLGNMLEVLKRADGDAARVPLAAGRPWSGSSHQLVRLVDDLLDLNRITHNRLELRKSPCELGSVIEQAVEAARPLAEAAGHRCACVAAPSSRST